MRRPLPVLPALILALASPAATPPPAGGRGADAPPCRVRLLTPGDDRVLYGPTELRAVAECGGNAVAARVLFLVDGQVVAEIRPEGDGRGRLEVRAEWDAGGTFRSRVVEARVIAGDGRAAAAVAVTPGSRFQESVRVRSTSIDLVELSVSVADGDGRAVRGLGAADFVVEEEGRPQRLDAVRPETRPLSLAILVDASDSTRAVWPALRRAAPDLARALGPADAAKVVAFNGPAYLVQDFTRDADAVAASMAAFSRWGGGTSLYDTLAAAGVELAWGRDGRQAVVVLTDGIDTLSRVDLPRLRNYLRRTEVVVSSFLLPPGPAAAPPLARFFERDMRTLCAETGGAFVRLRDPSGLEEAFRRLAEDLKDRYYIAYHAGRPVRAGAWRSLRVRVRRPGVTVRFRRGAIARRDIADYLREDLQRGSVRERSKAAEWLGELGAGAEPLLAALEDRAPEVRAAAAQALGRMRDPRALPRLARLLGDPAGEARRGASEALQAFGPVAVPALVAVLEEAGTGAAGTGRGEARLHALEVLARIGDPRGFDTIARLAAPPPPASAAPGGGPRAPRARADPRTRLWAVAALGDLGRPDGVPILARAAADRDPRVRQAGLAALGSLAVPDAVPALMRAIADPDRETRALAFRVLRALLRDGGAGVAGRVDVVPAGRRARLLDDCLAPLLDAARGRDPAAREAAGAVFALLEESGYPDRLVAAIAPGGSDPLRAALEERRRAYRVQIRGALDGL